jgi:hypothetical protein
MISSVTQTILQNPILGLSVVVIGFWLFATLDHFLQITKISWGWKRVGEGKILSKEFISAQLTNSKSGSLGGGPSEDTWKIAIEVNGIKTTLKVSYIDYNRYHPYDKVKVKYSRCPIHKQLFIHRIL